MPRGAQWRRMAAFMAAMVAVAVACTGSTGGAEPVPGRPAAVSTTTDQASPNTAVAIPPGVEPIIDPTPLPIDPDVRIGQLDNGLTYYVRSNDSPGGSLSVRLAVNAGSLQQVEATDQVAHFTEHMLFNGTTRYPGNQLDAELRALGAQIGPDLNAYTSFDETVYFLDISLVGDNADTAFTVLREWAGNALMDADEVVAERPVVREEFRLRREAAGASVFELFDEVYFNGTPYEGFSPIGTEEQIATTTADDTRAFYDRWYRPELMAVVAVGDLPAADLEALVRDGFADLERRGGDHPPRTEPDVDIDTPRAVEVLADPGLDQTYISVDYRVPARDPGTVGGEQLGVWDSLITTMISTRLDEAIARDASSLVRGGGGPFAAARNMYFLGFNLDGPDLATGTTEFLSLTETLVRDGFSDAELGRAKAVVTAQLEQELAALATRQDGEWADLYVSHYLGGADASSPADRNERIAGLIEATAVEDVTGYFRWIMETAEPLVIVVGPDPNELPTTTALLDAVEAASAGEGVGEEIETIDELVARPGPAEILASRRLSAAGGVEWRFDNGARVVFARSEIADGIVNLAGLSDGGWSLLASDEQPLLGPAADMVERSGLAGIDKVALDRYLADKVVSVAPFVFETGEGMSGESSSADLEIAFQLVHLYLTRPQVDRAAFNQVVAQQTELLRAVQNRPAVAAAHAVQIALNGESAQRNPVLDRAALDQLTPNRAIELYEQRFIGVDDLVLVVVGDVDEQSVEELARHYVGSLPARPPDSWLDLLPDPPVSVVTVERNAGPAGGAGVLSVVFRTLGSFDDADRVDGEILQAVLDERLFTRIREQLGASYSGGSAFVSFETEPDRFGQLAVTVSGDPERLDEIRATVLAELTRLVTAGPTPEEYTRALAVVNDRYSFVSNGDLIEQLLEEVTEEGPVLTNDAAFGFLDRTSSAQVRALAAEVIDTGAWIEVFVRPTE